MAASTTAAADESRRRRFAPVKGLVVSRCLSLAMSIFRIQNCDLKPAHTYSRLRLSWSISGLSRYPA